MKTVETICCHRVQFDYFTRSKKAVPNDSEIQHVRELINEDCREGELCLAYRTKNHIQDFRGYWKILPEVENSTLSEAAPNLLEALQNLEKAIRIPYAYMCGAQSHTAEEKEQLRLKVCAVVQTAQDAIAKAMA